MSKKLSMENRELEKKLEAYINSDIQERAEATKERALMAQAIENIEKSVSSLDKKLDKLTETYVTRAEFTPYKVALNITAGLVLTGIVGALLGLVLIK